MNINNELVLEVLNILRSREEQYRLWIDTSTPEMSNLGEEIFFLWDDSGLGDARDKGLFPQFFSKSLCREFEKFRKVADKVYDQGVAYKLDHPMVIEMRDIANNLYGMFEKETQ